MKQAFERHTWAEIDLDALTDNFRVIREKAGSMPLCAVVKADAYGHGAVHCARALAEAGAAYFAVSCLAEAVELRRAGIVQPIVILGHTEPAFAGALMENNVAQACFSLSYAQALSAAAGAAGGTLCVHLKVDTGMGRIGFAVRGDFDGAVAEMRQACALAHLKVTGLFQHFAVADSTAPGDIAYTAQQQALFCRVYEALCAAGQQFEVVHCDNSAGVMLHPEWPAALPPEKCMARPGIILYGFDPSSEVRFHCFTPVMRLKTVVSQVKTLAPGESTSYGRHFTAEKPTRVATLCAGYADGYPRLLSCGKGIVELHGQPAPVLGNVCMDQMMVDVSGIPGVQEGDEAILWGGRAGDSAESIADKTGTIVYEVLCGVSRRVPRIYRHHGETLAVSDFLGN